MRQSHGGGEKLFIDYAGDKMPVVVDRLTGEVRDAHIFVAVMGGSSLPSAMQPGPSRWATGSTRTTRLSPSSAGWPICWCPTMPRWR